MVNLAAFKEFVPGRVMIVVLVLVSLAGATYLINASSRGEHLTRRNFHNLNAIAENIGASLDTLDAVVEFAEPGCAAQNCTSVEDFAHRIKEKLGGAGSSISGGIIRQIDLDVKAETVSSDGSTTNAPGVDCKPDEEISNEPRPFYINRGQASLEGPLIKKIYVVTQVGADGVAQCLNMTVDYDVLDSGSAREGFFDTTVIASYSKERDNADFAKVISNSSSRGVNVSPNDIRQLFNAQSESLRMRTLQELEFAAAKQRAEAFTLSEDGASFSSNKDVETMPFSQSSVTSIEIGGESFYAFIQPLVLDSKLKLESDLVIVGLVKTTRFNQDKYGLPYNFLYLLLLLLLTAGLVISLLHLALIGDRELLLRKNSLLANISSLGVQAIAVLILMQAFSVSDFNSLFRTSNEGIFNSISSQFDAELEERYLRGVTAAPSMYPTYGSVPKLSPVTSRKYRGVENLFLLDTKGRQVGIYISNKDNPAGLGFKVPDRAYFRQIAQGNGWLYRTNSTNSSVAKDLEGRPYFLDRIESKIDGEIATVLSTTVENSAKTNFQNQQKTSIDHETGAIVLAYTSHFKSLRNAVLPAGFGFAVFDNVSGRVLFHSDQRRSLRENFYQATDDDEELKARVISRAPGQLELDYKGEKVSAYIGPLKEGIPWTLVAYYRTSVPDAFSFHYGFTGGMLALLHLMAMGLLAALVVGLLSTVLTSPAQRDAFRWRKVLQLPRWMRPLRKRRHEYRLLNLCLISILPIYAGIIYYIDDSVWLWYFIPPLTAVLVWHRLVRCELYDDKGDMRARFPRVVSAISLVTPLFAIAVIVFSLYSIWRNGGALYSLVCCLWLLICFGCSFLLKQRSESDKARKGLAVYKCTVMLFGLVSAILPTLVLLNHNYDIHEQLWVRFSSWATVDRLKARHSYYTSDAQNFSHHGSISHFTLNDWSGVYLPRTEIFSLEKAQKGSAGNERRTAKRHSTAELLNAGGKGEYYNGYLLAQAVGGDGSLDQKIGFESSKLELSFYDDETSLDESLSLPRIVRQWLPNLSDIGNMIENFDRELPAASRYASSQGDQGEGDDKNNNASLITWVDNELVLMRLKLEKEVSFLRDGSCDKSSIAGAVAADFEIGEIVNAKSLSERNAPEIRSEDIASISCQDSLKKSIYTESHDRAGINYRILNWYPHTRSPAAYTYIAGILAFALIIAGLFYILNSWLVTRFFTNAFEDGLYVFPPPTKTAHSPLREGGILVCAADTTLDHFIALVEQEYGEHYWGDLIPLNLSTPGLNRNWKIVRSAKTQTTIGFLSCDELNRDTLHPDILEHLDKAYRDGDIVIVMTAIDLRYTIVESYSKDTESPTSQTDGRSAYPQSNALAWRAFLSDLPTFFLKLDLDPSRKQIKKGLWDAWKKSTQDEQMVLAGLVYDDSSNPKNKSTLTSLYRRSLIRTSNYGFKLSNPDIRSVVKAQCSLERYRKLRRTYGNQTWLTWKKPIILVVTLLMVFVLFVARDQLSGVFSIFATVLTGIATVGLIGERLREFGGTLINKGG